MSWNYNPTNMRDLDRVRLLIGDKFDTDPQIQDEEIYTFLILEGQTQPRTTTASRTVLYRAASKCAQAIANFYARQVDFSSGSAKQAVSQRMAHYQAMAADLVCRATASPGGGPRVGGQSQSAKFSSRQDQDLTQPFFARDAFTEPGTGPNENLLGDQQTAEFAP